MASLATGHLQLVNTCTVIYADLYMMIFGTFVASLENKNGLLIFVAGVENKDAWDFLASL